MEITNRSREFSPDQNNDTSQKGELENVPEPIISNMPDADEAPASFMGFDLDTSTIFTAFRSDWIVVESTNVHICADKCAMTEYHEYGPDEETFEWIWLVGEVHTKSRAIGKGKANINLVLEGGKTNTLSIDCFYDPKSIFSIFSTEKPLQDRFIFYDDENHTFHDLRNKMQVIGHAVEENGYPFLKTTDSTIKERFLQYVRSKCKYPEKAALTIAELIG
ncbi:hypothetical protein N7478_010418 [Penicillium angulare]|uniref:uncharacterized protein n=1 Tax=Penicillium angulare TaxID=116970 RepID=UPI0025408303|nr:uncharacterized protein N7478_010418 [Penicillium angulare]KAJ5267610.1 hypothetical protein N7478_010418 [Penicillium angulare]